MPARVASPSAAAKVSRTSMGWIMFQVGDRYKWAECLGLV